MVDEDYDLQDQKAVSMHSTTPVFKEPTRTNISDGSRLRPLTNTHGGANSCTSDVCDLSSGCVLEPIFWEVGDRKEDSTSSAKKAFRRSKPTAKKCGAVGRTSTTWARDVAANSPALLFAVTSETYVLLFGLHIFPFLCFQAFSPKLPVSAI